jgi:hypothetical protein
MDTRPDDLGDLERRLAALAPTGDGLDADRMLFAAGRASVSAAGGSVFWKALSALLLVLAAGLGVWGANERKERIGFAARMEGLERNSPQPLPVEAPVLVAETPSGEAASADSLLASHHILETGLEGLPVTASHSSTESPSAADLPILRARPTTGWPGL